MALHIEEVDLGSAELPGDDLHELMRRARDTGPVVSTTFLGSPAHLLTRQSTVRDYFAAHEQFPGGAVYQFGTRPHIGSTFIDLDGAEHDAYRRLATPAFRSRAVARFVDADLTPLAHEVLDRLAPAGAGDLATELAQVLPFWAISRKLGLPIGSEERQRAWALALLSYPTHPDAALRAASDVADFLRPTIDARRSDPGDDVISRLLTAEVDGLQLDDDQVVAHIRLLYAVGATTTSDSLSTVLHRLLSEPELVERARSTPDVLPRFVNESLRMEPAVSILPRLAPLGGELEGVELAPGAIVLCGIAAANRDPEVYHRPDEFDPDRAETEILSFGFGQKFCPGSHLARQQLLAALEALLERLPDLRLASADAPTGSVLRRVERLEATWTPPER